MAPDDDALMIRFKRGDARAFEQLYSRHRAPLYRYFLRQAPRDAVDDLFQDAWFRIVNAAQGYAPRGSFSAYLYRIAHSVLVDFYRRAGRAPAPADATVSDLPDGGDGPVAAHERSVLRRRITAALEALPPAQREAFLLQQEAGLTLEQIAEVVGSSRETVKSRLRYATARLRQALGDESESWERSA